MVYAPIDLRAQSEPASSSSAVSITVGVPYCRVPMPDQCDTQNLFFDFYISSDTSTTLRPLVITLFGGGFVIGSRSHEDMTAWCHRLVGAGFAAASIDYRVMPARKFSSTNLIRTGYMAAQDVSAAVRYFKANGDKYHIDTSRIFLLGQSAGAVAIIHALFMDEEQRPSETFAEPVMKSLHSIEPFHSQPADFSVAGAVLLWGCIFDPQMIDADEDIPICMIHGERDKILPITEGHAFSIRRLPHVYGSQSIADRMQSIGLNSYELHLFEDKPHAFYFKYIRMYRLKEEEFDKCFEIATDFMRAQGLH